MILALKITSLGDDSSSATDRRWRFSWGVPTGGTSDWRDLFIDSLIDEFPAEIATSVDFRAARTTTGALTVKLQKIPAVTTRLYRKRHLRIGRLRSDISATGLSCRIDDNSGTAIAGLTGTTIALERECITLGAYSAPNYTITRGRLGTVASSHPGYADTIGADSECYNADHGHLREDREVVLIRVPTDGEEADEEVIYRGALRNLSSSGPVISIETRTVVEYLRGRKLMSNPWRRRLQYVSDSEARIVPIVDDPAIHRGTIDGQVRLPISIEGQAALLNRYDPYITGSAEEMAVQPTQLGGTRSQPFAGGKTPDKIPEEGADIWEFCSLSPQSPGINSGGPRLGQETSLSAEDANPFTFLLQVLLTTVEGDNHPTYDLGNSSRPRVGENLGLGIPSDLVDIDAIETVRARTPAYMPSLHLGFDGKAIDALELLQRIMRVYGCVVTIGEAYKLTVVKLESVRRTFGASVTDGDFIGLEDDDLALTTTFDRVSVTYRDLPGRDSVVEGFTDEINRRRLASGRHDVIDLDASGVYSRDRVSSLVQGLIQRFHAPIPRLRFKLNNVSPLWPGDLVSVTWAPPIGTSGTRGLTSETFLIVGRRFSLKTASISYDALDVGAAFGRIGLISGALKLTSGTPVTWTNKVGCSSSSDQLTKTAANGWNAGASSVETLSGDGWAEFTVGQTTDLFMFGLSNGDSGVGYADIDFSWYAQAAGLARVQEGGSFPTTSWAYTASSVFRVAVESGVVKYYIDGVLKYTSASSPTYPLLVDTALFTSGCVISTCTLTAADELVHEQNEYTATTGPSDEIQDDNDAFAVGDRVVLVDSALGIKDATAKEISAIPSETTVELTSARWATAAAGDIVVPADYTVVVAAQTALWSWLADATPAVGTTDDPYEWDQ